LLSAKIPAYLAVVEVEPRVPQEDGGGDIPVERGRGGGGGRERHVTQFIRNETPLGLGFRV